MTASPRSITEIASYHAHVYYDPVTTRSDAEKLREGVGERFLVRLGRWHDVLVGPHSSAMYQIAFEPSLFETLVPWLMLNHRGLSILIHPNTRNPRRDHLVDGIWIGARLPIKKDSLTEDEPEADVAGEPNTSPSKDPWQ